MASETDSETPVFLYIAAYADPDAAQVDWDTMKELAKEKVVAVDGLGYGRRHHLSRRRAQRLRAEGPADLVGTLAGEDRERRLEQNRDVEPDRPVLEVVEVEADEIVEGQI
jgi:hypothetical protein